MDCDSGICLGNSSATDETPIHCTRCIVRNNFLTRTPENGIYADYTRDCKILNNTLYQNDTLHFGIGELYVQFDTRNNVIENNIFYANSQNIFIMNEYTQNTGNVVDDARTVRELERI